MYLVVLGYFILGVVRFIGRSKLTIVAYWVCTARACVTMIVMVALVSRQVALAAIGAYEQVIALRGLASSTAFALATMGASIGAISLASALRARRQETREVRICHKFRMK